MNSQSVLKSIAAVAALTLAACSQDESTGPSGPSPTRQITVDASTNWAYLRFEGDSAVIVAPPTNAQTSSDWHMAFLATSVMLNGGAAGPGGVSGYCICQNSAATNTEIMAMTPATQAGVFDSVTIDNVVPAPVYQQDVLVPVIAGWYAGGGVTAVAHADSSWIISEGSGSTRILGKFRVTSISGATVSAPGSVTFEWAVQSTPGGAFGTTHTSTVTVGATPVNFDFTTGAVTTSATDWDVQFSGWDIRLNSGVSGSGTVKGLSAGSTTFSTIDATFAASPPASAFKSDAFGGVFASHKWYKYNITGTDNQIWPTFDIYLIRIGTSVFKVQLISYYNTAGTSRQITIRYAKIAD